KVSKESASAQANVGRLENDLAAAREVAAEATRLKRARDGARRASPPSMTPKPGAVSSREFLDLREGLNRKDKEILALRDQLSRKDKELLENADKELALEREKADQSDKLLE